MSHADSVDGRRYPARPVAGVGAVIVTTDHRIVLVQRQHAPLARQWSLPGGAIELGESATGAIAREVLEETGLVVDVGGVVEVVDHVTTDTEGRVVYHFVIVDYLCRVVGGDLRAASDASAVALVDAAEVEGYQLTEAARRVIARALTMCAEAAPGCGGEPAATGLRIS